MVDPCPFVRSAAWLGVVNANDNNTLYSVVGCRKLKVMGFSMNAHAGARLIAELSSDRMNLPSKRNQAYLQAIALDVE